MLPALSGIMPDRLRLMVTEQQVTGVIRHADRDAGNMSAVASRMLALLGASVCRLIKMQMRRE